jgi:hypothetical protein
MAGTRRERASELVELLESYHQEDSHTLSEADFRRALKLAHEINRDVRSMVYAAVTVEGDQVVDLEFLDESPKWTPEAGQTFREGYINGGDSADITPRG